MNVKPSIKSVEGGSTIAIVASAIVAVYVIITKDTQTLSPENIELILTKGLDQAKTVQDIVELYKMADSPTDYTKIFELVSVLLSGSGVLGFFTKKRSDVKMQATELLSKQSDKKCSCIKE